MKWLKELADADHQKVKESRLYEAAKRRLEETAAEDRADERSREDSRDV